MTEAELKQQLTAAHEQLAEMRQVLEDIEWIDDTSYGPGCPFCWQAREYGHDEKCGIAQALSAAPKRGRVLWEKTVTFEIEKDGDVAGWCEDIADYVVFFIDRGELILGKPHIVTVREAE